MSSIALSWTPPGTFHHVGFVVASIENAAHSFAESIQARWDGKVIYDPNQLVQVTFLQGQSPTDPLFELVEPAGEKSPVLSFLQRGGGLHHVCYVVDSMDEALERSRLHHGPVVRAPFPAAAFCGRRVAWVYTKNKLLIEYLEK